MGSTKYEKNWWDKANKGSVNEKDSDFKKDRLDELLNKQREMKRQHQDTVGAEEDRSKKAEATIDPDSHEGKQRYWDKVNQSANHLLDDNAAGYQEFPNFMMNLVHHGLLIARANWYDPIDLTYFVPYRDEIGASITMVKRKVYDNTLAHLENAIDRQFMDDKDLPKIGFDVSLNAQNQIEVKVTKNGELVNKKFTTGGIFTAEGMPDMDDLDTKLQMSIDTGVVAWLKLQGYEFDPSDQTFTHKTDNSILTNDKLKELKAVPEKSLHAHLNKRVDMSLKDMSIKDEPDEPTSSSIPSCA